MTGVTFQSPVDGSRMLLTPEESIHIQNNLGADIMMQLDDVVPATNTGMAARTMIKHNGDCSLLSLQQAPGSTACVFHCCLLCLKCSIRGC